MFGELFGEELLFAKDVEIKDFADVVYNLFGARKLTINKLGGEQCSSGRYRSINDCEALCRGYKIDGNIYRAIHQIREDSAYQILGWHYCSDVGRQVHFLYRTSLSVVQIREILEAKNINFKKNG